MYVKGISRYIRLACITLAALLPLELSAQHPPRPTTRPFRPMTRDHRPPPAPKIQDLERLLHARKAQVAIPSRSPSTQRSPGRPTPTPTPAPTASKVEAVSSTPPLATTLPAGERGIQFSFNNAPVSTVFDFFERITGIPILGERNVPGTISYLSRKKMTVDEAVEELNLLLAGKNVVLTRTDDHQVIGRYPDVLRNVGRDFTSADRFLSSDVPANEVVRVFFNVTTLSAEELTSLLADTLPLNEVKLAAWPATNQIQIVALASQVRKVVNLAKKLDREFKMGESGLTFKVFKPKFIQPSILDRIIRTVLPAGGTVTGPGNYQLGNPGAMGAANVIRSTGDKGFQMSADDMTGTLVVRGNSASIDQVSKLIDILDVQEQAGNITAERIAIKYGSTQTLEMVLNESVKQRAMTGMGARTGQSLSIRGDEGTRSIVLAGPRNLVDQAKQIIDKLDKPSITERIQIIPLTSARAETVFQSILAPFYSNARRQPPAAADALSNSIITWATGNEFDELKSLLQQVDQAAKEGRGVPVVRIFRIEDMDVNRIVGPLQQMFAKQQDVTFGADPASKIIMATGPAEKLDRVEKVLADIKSHLTGQKVTTQVVEVKYANVDQVGAAVRQAFTARRLPTGEARIDVAPNAQSNSVLLTGLPADIEEAVRLIRQLDDRIHSASEIKTYKLNFAQSDDLQKMIQELYGAKDPTLKVVSDPWTNTLFLSGGSGNLEAIDLMIKSMDHSEPETTTSTNIAFISLKTASARDVADQIDSMLSGTGGKNLPTIDAADIGNYLIVTGQPKQIERIRQMAEQIDKMAKQIPEIVAVRPIPKISAERLAQMLNAIVPQQSATRVNLMDVDLSDVRRGMENFMKPSLDAGAGSGFRSASQPSESTVTIGVDKRTNTLVIRGRPREIEIIDKAIKSLTADLQEDVQFKIYTLKYANPSDVASNLEALFNEAAPGQPGAAPPQPTAAPPGQQPGGPQAAGRGGRGMRQGQAQQPAVVTRRIRAIPVDQINSVVVRADPRDFLTIEQFITDLDYPVSGNVQMFKLKYARADVISKTLSELYRSSGGGGGGRRRAMMMGAPGQTGGQPGVSFSTSYDLGTNTLIVTATKTQLKEIETIIATLDNPSGTTEVFILPLKSGRAEQMAPMIQKLLHEAEAGRAQQTGTPAQSMALSFDKPTNSLVFAGTSQQFDLVKSMVDRLESVRPATGEKHRIFVVPLRNLDPNQAKKILDELLPGGTGGGSSLLVPTRKTFPNLKDDINLLIYRLVVAQASRGNSSATTQPSPKSVPPESSADQRARQLKALQQIMQSRMRTKAPGQERINHPPTQAPTKTPASPAAPTTAPATKEPFTRFPKTIVQPGAAKGSRPEQLSAKSVQELQALASRIKSNVDITAVSDQNALIIDATDQDYQVVQQVLNLIDQVKPSYGMRVIKLKNARAQDLADVVGRIFASRPVPRGMPPITLTPDLATNSLLISATPEMMSEIEQLVNQLDTQKDLPQMDFKVYPLKNARAAQLVPQIQKMLQEVMQSRGATQAPITLTSDDRTNSIIVTAPQSYMEQINKLITTLDAVPAYSTVNLEIIRLKKADANQLSTLLTSLTDPSLKRGTGNEMLNRLQVSLARAGETGTLDLEKPIKVIPDKDTQSVLLLSTADNLKLLKHIVQILDTVPLAEDLRVRVYPVKIADAQEVQRTLTDIFSKRMDLVKVPGTAHNEGVPENATGQAIIYPVVIVADRASNTIVASGQETSLALIEVLIGQLDQEIPNILFPIRTLGLKNASAKDLSRVLQDILDARANRAADLNAQRKSKVAKSFVRADERMNALVICASPEDYDMITALVKKLDLPPEPGVIPTIIALQNIDATTMAELLDKFFKERNQVKPTATEIQLAFPATTPVIIPEPRSNTLVVSAGKTTLPEIKMLVNRLDNANITKKMQVAVIPLRSADASQLATAITQALNPTQGQAGLKQAVILEFIKQTPEGKTLLKNKALKDQIYVYGDKTSNLMIVVAPEDTVRLIRSLAQDIDDVAPSVEIRVFALVHADASTMKKTIDDLFTSKGGGRTGGGPTTTAPSLTIGGETVSGGGASSSEQQTIAVTADSRTNSLIVSATPTYMKLIETIIKKLDSQELEQRKTEIITLKNADADTVQKAVSTLIENRIKIWTEAYGKEGLAPERLLEQQVTIVSDNATRKLIVEANPRFFGVVKKIIDELDTPQSQVLIQVMIVQVTLDNRLEYGFEAVGQDLSFTKAQTAPGIGPGHDVVVGSDVGAGALTSGGFTFSLHGEDFNLLLRALNSDGKSQVLSRPQILAQDNFKSSIQIGQNVPIPTGAVVSQVSASVSPTLQYQDVGVILTVTPHINSDGYVILDVTPEISSVSSSSIPITAGLNAPIINKNKLDTRVTIKDGETVVIGGLITKNVTHNETKVPFLGDIPFLGYAFKSLSDTETRSELLVVLTPKLMETTEKARSLSAEERDLMQLLPRDVRESRLMGQLRQEFDEEGYPIATTAPAVETEDEKNIRLFSKPQSTEFLLRGLKRTIDQ